MQPTTLPFLLLLSTLAASFPAARAEPWQRHTIDNAGRGADGIRVADFNRDGLPDLVSAYEQSGHIRLMINPGPGAARRVWPAVTVGQVRDPEDAVMVDLDGDGQLDVVSACEGNTRRLYAHWAPSDPERAMDASAWRTQPFPAADGLTRWMFCTPMQIDGRHGPDLIVGSKDDDGQIGWLGAPSDPRNMAAWNYHPLRNAGWIMSLIAADMDSDGDYDILFSDRRGSAAGVYWLENPGPASLDALRRPWKQHPISAEDGRQVMFLAHADLDGDGLMDVLAAVKPREIAFFRSTGRDGQSWQRHSIALPPSAGTAKAVSVGDIDLDGRRDLVFTCEGATGASGVMWLSYDHSPTDPRWTAHDISGHPGVKYDLAALLDLDGDGDPDVITTEEVDGLGVIWYENPARQPD